MAYFPNGTSFLDWQETACEDCLNDRDNGSGSTGCAIKDALFILSYEDELSARPFVEFLIPEKGEKAWQCAMKLTRADVEADEREAYSATLREKYTAAMAEMKAVEGPRS